jgi:hypothetical protein
MTTNKILRIRKHKKIAYLYWWFLGLTCGCRSKWLYCLHKRNWNES